MARGGSGRLGADRSDSGWLGVDPNMGNREVRTTPVRLPTFYIWCWLVACPDSRRIRRESAGFYHRCIDVRSRNALARQKSTGGQADFSIFFDFIYVFVIYLLILLLFIRQLLREIAPSRSGVVRGDSGWLGADRSDSGWAGVARGRSHRRRTDHGARGRAGSERPSGLRGVVMPLSCGDLLTKAPRKGISSRA